MLKLLLYIRLTITSKIGHNLGIHGTHSRLPSHEYRVRKIHDRRNHDARIAEKFGENKKAEGFSIFYVPVCMLTIHIVFWIFRIFFWILRNEKTKI